MTQAELDALPEAGNIALFQKPEDGIVVDNNGVTWLIGWSNDVRFKRRCPA